MARLDVNDSARRRGEVRGDPLARGHTQRTRAVLGSVCPEGTSDDGQGARPNGIKACERQVCEAALIYVLGTSA